MTSGEERMVYTIFFLICWEKAKEKINIDCIPMFCEFADAFPKELPCLPPHREMDFCNT